MIRGSSLYNTLNNRWWSYFLKIIDSMMSRIDWTDIILLIMCVKIYMCIMCILNPDCIGRQGPSYFVMWRNLTKKRQKRNLEKKLKNFLIFFKILTNFPQFFEKWTLTKFDEILHFLVVMVTKFAIFGDEIRRSLQYYLWTTELCLQATSTLQFRY